MSRAKSRNNSEICADCGSADPSWASVNKGIYLCAECCSIHRSLGRHISQVKSLSKSQWNQHQLLMVQTLNNNGVNNIWEHCLLDNNSKFLKRKPQPKDPLQPVKTEFIRAKHLQFAFVFRPNRDDSLCTESELGKQLHSSVRTGNLEMSVRLLIQGADPNYFHDEKGTTPLHVAAKANQILQAELLIINGADPSSPDAHGVTPMEYARNAGNVELAERLLECMYEVTDKLIYYICGKKPDHLTGKHFILPDKINSDPVSLSKLQKLSNQLFEELVTDVYDEIDRRETEAIWLSSTDSLELSTVPFLPVDPGLSTTRNQGRQKLARFTAKELKQLVSDILNDIRRRQQLGDKDSKSSLPQMKHTSQISDDEPLYDSVASDEDYAILTPESNVPNVDKSEIKKPENPNTSITASPIAVEVLTKRLLQSDNTISDLRAEVKVLQSIVEKLNSENSELKSRLSQTNSENNSVNGSINVVPSVNGSTAIDLNYLVTQTNSLNLGNPTNIDAVHNADMKSLRRGQRPTSMYETREGYRTPNWQLMKNQAKGEDGLRSSFSPNMCGVSDTHKLEHRLTKCTENITHCIQDMWKYVQSADKIECWIPAVEKIREAVTELTNILPQGAANDNTRLLLDNASRLQLECANLHQATISNDVSEQEYYKQKVRSTAYDMAKATKILVTKYLINLKGSGNEVLISK